MANETRETKTPAVDGPSGRTHAVMMALTMDEPSRTRECAGEVLDQFKPHRTVSRPDKSLLLVTINRDVDLEEFRRCLAREVYSGHRSQPIHVTDARRGLRSQQAGREVPATRSLR